MNDRELLEMAARAIGFGLCADGKYTVCWAESDYPRGAKTNGALWNYIGHGETAQLWNPLTDDGDALRLAVKLQLQIRPNDYDVMVVAHLPAYITVAEVCDHKDPYAATRRAIVRAAAEIGREVNG